MTRPPAAPRPVAYRSPRDLARANRLGGFHQTVGFLIDAEQSGEGYCTVAGTVDQRHLNINGVVHGGVYATILDTAMGGAVVTTLGEGETTATTSLYVEFLRGAREDAVLRARGDVLRRGRHLAFAEGNLYDAEGHRLSQAHGTWYIWSAEEPPSSRRGAPTPASRRSGARSSRRS
ncbi:MAG: PaaI family thioesterase [Thermoplasmata archaeon]|nr:PaaI family thioesterase [Thermoplasmata archaeon]